MNKIGLTKRVYIYILTEYIACGTLKDRLHDMSEPLPWIERVKFAKDIADGMVGV